MAGEQRRSKVEDIKEASDQLRGGIADALRAHADGFSEADATLLKQHGLYQGRDRDAPKPARGQAVERAHQFMVRARLPGGRLTAEQYLALDDLAGRYANGTLRITTRQSVQFHGLLRRDLKQHIARMNAALVTTVAACGDVVRNVTTVPAPIRDAVHARLEDDARRLSVALEPRSGAYREIWLDGERLDLDGAPEEPLYGATYLPRKFKIGLATPADNSIDVLTNDLAILALFDGDELQGYQFCLGGGLGQTHHNEETYARLATPVAFVAPHRLLEAAEAAVKLARDHGDRGNRKHARLKYLVEERGETWARERMEEYLGAPLSPPRPLPELHVVDHLGWHPQGDGRWYMGVPLPAGRIADGAHAQLRTALREVVTRWRPRVVLTPNQDLLLADLRLDDRADLEAALRGRGVRLVEQLLPVQRWSMACVALPTCGLALAEAERIREPLVREIADALERQGIAHEPVAVRVTGCANACARPTTAEIGIVGRTPNHYSLFVGGDFNGTRLARPLLDRVPREGIAAALEPLFAFFARERRPGERFGEFCARHAVEELAGFAEVAAAQTLTPAAARPSHFRPPVASALPKGDGRAGNAEGLRPATTGAEKRDVGEARPGRKRGPTGAEERDVGEDSKTFSTCAEGGSKGR